MTSFTDARLTDITTVLMLVIDDSPYGARVPIQIGTLHIDMAISLATEGEHMKFKKKWEHAEMASYFQMAGMQTIEPVINLEEINGTVHLTHNLSLGPFETATLAGLLKGPVKDSAYVMWSLSSPVRLRKARVEF